MKKLLKALCCAAALYLLQFAAAPALVPGLYPRSNEAYGIFLVLAVLVSLAAFLGLEVPLSRLVLSDAAYFLLILLWCGEGAYGIGLRGMNLDGMSASFHREAVWPGALAALAVVIAVQLACAAIAAVIKKLRRSQ